MSDFAKAALLKPVLKVHKKRFIPGHLLKMAYWLAISGLGKKLQLCDTSDERPEFQIRGGIENNSKKIFLISQRKHML